MPYETSGTLTTDKRTVDDATTWDTQTEWEAYQSANNVSISNGVVQLAEYTAQLPASAIHRRTISEGSGSTVEDSIGSNDVTLSGGYSWESVTDAQDGYELSFDGSSGYGTGSTVSALGAGNQFSIGLTINPDSLSGDQTILTHVKGSDDRTTIGISGSEIVAQAYDGSFVDPRTLGTASETSRMRLLVTFDLVGDDISIYKNTTLNDSSFGGAGMLNDSEVGEWWATRGLQDTWYSGDMDDVIYYDEILDSNGIQSDYNIQPWS